MKYIIQVCLLIFISGATAFGQNVEFSKDNYKDRKDELKTALKAIKAGDLHWEEMKDRVRNGLPWYVNRANSGLSLAIPAYEEAQAFNPNNAELNFKLGRCYLYSVEKFKALAYFQKAFDLKPDVSRYIHYYLGAGHHLNYEWEKAITEYEYFRKYLDQKTETDDIFWVNKKIEECRVGRKLKDNPERVWIDNLGPELNSKYPEYSAFISTDEEVVIFTSRRESTMGGEKDPTDNKYFEDVYISRRKNRKAKWSRARNMGENINSESHDASAGISPDGRTMFVYNGRKNYGDIFMSRQINGVWTEVKPLGKNINTKEHTETSACLSYDGKELFFVSTRPGGFGGRDIYKSTWNEEKERWGPAQNLGPVINSKYDEDGVFIHPDGKRLYFSSSGGETMGDYDIFWSTLEDGKWTKPKNLGYPINTPAKDIFFVVSANGRFGYMSSFRQEGLGDMDLYKVTFLGPAKEPLLNSEDQLLASIAQPIKEKSIEPKVEVRKSRLAILKGTVKDEETQAPLVATIELIDNELNETLATFESDGALGTYLLSLPAGKNYGIAVKLDGYLFHSENFNIPDSAGFHEYNVDVLLKKIDIGSTIVLRNIFFDQSKTTLRDESISELNRLNKLLIENPTLRIEISGHTDSDGSDSYNQKLSEGRAAAVVKYLSEHGIASNRLEYKGYGESQPIADNKTDEGKQENRRTEFKILSK